MPQLNFTVTPDKCVQCDACVQDCPRGIISRTGELPEVIPARECECLECQHCLAVCPTGAVSIFGLRPEHSLALTPEKLPSAQQMHTLLRGRRSVRQYKEENVPRMVIEELLATLAHAPTGCNDRDLHFLVVDNRQLMKALLEKLLETLEEKAQNGILLPELILSAVTEYRDNGVDEIFRGAPHLLIAWAGTKASCPKEDIALALAYFELLAQCSGLGTVWCGFLELITDTVPELRSCLGLGLDTPFYAMLFGYPAVHYARTVQRDEAAVIQRFPFPGGNGAS
ncbi:MAG: nitroreductase family protein [Syntrophomonadaceae bacterium]|jgi:nitroreductase/NAD-dependent dihydropyrimidine dehydrogenase PreA subunit|nr:nitroreductase family protein [Syntrophomonadaceae bacterium]